MSTIIAQSASEFASHRPSVNHDRRRRARQHLPRARVRVCAVAVEVWRGVLGSEGTRPVDVRVEQRVEVDGSTESVLRPADYNQFGSCQATWRLGDGYVAASDPRRDGQAVGF
jgi:hypothetical protein